jgi:hypothetical protein
MDRDEIYDVIDGERRYQVEKWGQGGTALGCRPSRFPVFHGQDGPEHAHEVAAFITFMRHYLTLADQAATTEAGDDNALDILRKVVALGVNCFEQHGVPAR